MPLRGRKRKGYRANPPTLRRCRRRKAAAGNAQRTVNNADATANKDGCDLCNLAVPRPGACTGCERSHSCMRDKDNKRLGQKGEAILFLQPSEAEYTQELKKHGV